MGKEIKKKGNAGVSLLDPAMDQPAR